MIRATWKKSIALLLVLLLIATPLAACGKGEPEEEAPPVETEAPATPEPPEPEEEETPELRLPGDIIAGIGRHEVIFELDDMPLLWEEMYHYLQSTRHMLEQWTVIEDWDADSGEIDADGEPMTFNELLIHSAITNALQHRAVQRLFYDLDETLDEGRYQEAKQDYMEMFEATEEEFLAMLWEGYLTEDVFIYIFSAMEMHNQAMAAIVGENGENVPAEAVNAFVEEHEILRAKHILLSTQDENRQDLPDDEIAVISARALELYEELAALTGQAQRIRFQEMLDSYGEDPGMLMNPEGYTFMPHAMVAEFTAGTQELEIDEIGPPVRSGFGYHIILRLPVEEDQFVMLPGGAQPMPIQGLAGATYVESILEEIKAELQTQYRTTPLFDRIVPGEIFAAAD